MTGKLRSNIRPGALGDLVLKRDQPTGKLTRGHVKRILTNSPSHPHGIKAVSYTHLTLPTTSRV